MSVGAVRDMIDLLGGFIKAERTMNWDLHLHTVRDMLPYVIGSRYLPYLGVLVKSDLSVIIHISMVWDYGGGDQIECWDSSCIGTLVIVYAGCGAGLGLRGQMWCAGSIYTLIF